MMAMDARQAKGLAIFSDPTNINYVSDDLFTIKSQGGMGTYQVDYDGTKWKCNCPDFIKRETDCKHIYAIKFYLQVNRKEDQVKYSQNWTAYNKAQIDEGEIFDNLLRELVMVVPEPTQHMGRPRLSLQEQIFCSVKKVYSQLSSRRASSLYRQAKEKECLSHTPHFNAVSKLLNKETVTPTLYNLIRLSAKPLTSLENDFGIDSSGFRTTSFGSFCVEKHKTKKQNIWLKAHISSGARTNIIADVKITDGNVNDTTQFKPLVIGTDEFFEIFEISADKAYSSKSNHEAVENVGGKAFIPFKSNVTGKARGSSTWAKAFHFFQMFREEFDEHYHKRSNVESTFGAIKKKFGETLKSKNRVAQENELLCKLLAYNITVLIHEMYENGITPSFQLNN